MSKSEDLVHIYYFDNSKLSHLDDDMNWDQLAWRCGLTSGELKQKVLEGTLSEKQLEKIEETFQDSMSCGGQMIMYKFDTMPIEIKSQDDILQMDGIDFFTDEDIYDYCWEIMTWGKYWILEIMPGWNR